MNVLVCDVTINQLLVVTLLKLRIIPKVGWAVENICWNVRLNTYVVLGATVWWGVQSCTLWAVVDPLCGCFNLLSCSWLSQSCGSRSFWTNWCWKLCCCEWSFWSCCVSWSSFNTWLKSNSDSQNSQTSTVHSCWFEVSILFDVESLQWCECVIQISS